MNSEWRKSSHSGGANNQCVEVSGTGTGILVRDTTDRAGAMLSIAPSAWTTFLATIH